MTQIGIMVLLLGVFFSSGFISFMLVAAGLIMLFLGVLD